MAVHGAAPSIMAPAMYSPASAGLMKAPYSLEKNIQAKNAMVNGFISQFTVSVSSSPLGFLPTFLIDEKST